MDIKQQWQQTPLWQRIFLLIIIALVISYFIFLIFIEPNKSKYDELKVEVNNMEAQLETLKVSANVKTLEKLEKKIKELKEENYEKERKIEKFKSSIPTEAEVDKVLSFISEKSKSSGLVVNSFKVEKEEDIQLYYDDKEGTLKTFNKDDKNIDKKIAENLINLRKIVIQVSLHGDIKSIFPLINSISSSERVIVIDKLEIKKEVNKLNYLLTFSIYYSPEET